MIPTTLWAALCVSALVDTSAHSTFRGSFYESTTPARYDLRFRGQPLSPSKMHEDRSYLMKTYLSTAADLGVVTWLAHGSLLGWYWNRSILPWASGLDVQTTAEDIKHLSERYNMTMYHFADYGSDIRRDYMLEVNSNWPDESAVDMENETSAHWIDVHSGLYIDIKPFRCLHKSNADVKGVKTCEDEHPSMYENIFPLRDTVFEGVAAKVPSAFADLLTEEYGLLH